MLPRSKDAAPKSMSILGGSLILFCLYEWEEIEVRVCDCADDDFEGDVGKNLKDEVEEALVDVVETLGRLERCCGTAVSASFACSWAC